MRRHLRASGLGVRLLAVQALVIGVGALTLALTAQLVAPSVFRSHLARSGVTMEPVRHHAYEAFSASLALSLTLSAVVALAVAAITSVVIVRRVAQPVERLAAAADAVAGGDFRVSVPRSTFSTELDQLSTAFTRMARRLADTDEARARLLSDLSHELRTPLATLVAYVDGMEDGVVPTESQSWDTMRNQIARLQRLAIDVRDAATADDDALDMHMNQLDLVTVALPVVDALLPRYTAHQVALAYEGPQSAMVNGDAARLGQVFTNLLDNALRHTPARGRVTVTITTTRDAAVVTVADTGTGIPADEIDAIFERFHRGDPSRAVLEGSGSGLGLTIARNIVQAHRGTLVAESDASGSTFTMTLPLL